MRRVRSIAMVSIAWGLLAMTSQDLRAAAEPFLGWPVEVVKSPGTDQTVRQPQAAVDSTGRIYIVFGQEKMIRAAVSTDGGRTFQLNTVGSIDSLALGKRRGPRIVATTDAVVVTAIGDDNGTGQGANLLAWRSNDSGKTWRGPTKLNLVEGSAREGLHGMATGPNGRIFCAWLDFRNKKMEVHGAVSKDAGATWEPDCLIYRSPAGSVCECCHPSVAYSPEGVLQVMWRNQIQGSRDLFHSSSLDDGKSFDAAKKLGRKTWVLNACPMDGGAIACGPNGAVESVWMRAGTIYSAVAGNPERKLGDGLQPWATFGPDGAYFVWLDRRPGRLLVKVPGQTDPVVLAHQANDPVIASGPAGKAPVVAVWESPSDGAIVSQVLADR